MKKLKYVGIFILTFFLFCIILVSFFPTDENNQSLAPNWFPMLGILVSIGVTWYKSKKDKRKEKSSKAPRKVLTTPPALAMPKAPVSAPVNTVLSQQKQAPCQAHTSISSPASADVCQPPPDTPDKRIDTVTYSLKPKISISDVLKMVSQMEQDFDITYKFANNHFLNAQDCQRAFSLLCKKWGDDTLPIPVQLRFDELKGLYHDRFQSPNPMLLVDNMTGHEFEQWCALLLQKNGFADVSVTPGSGDQGVDVLASKDGVYYAIQCKCYHSDLGNTPVQEVYAGKEYYRCQVGVVMTNRHFTDSAKQLASHTRVLLWDREKIIEMLEIAGEYHTSPLDAFTIGTDILDDDELLPAAVEVVLETGQASVSMLQRRLKLGYSRAARLVDQMEERGIVGPFEGSKPRQLLIDKAKWQEMQMGKAEAQPEFDRAGTIRDVFESHDALE